jgi:peptidoglycan-N-acetylglucosamine deacetylase
MSHSARRLPPLAAVLVVSVALVSCQDRDAGRARPAMTSANRGARSSPVTSAPSPTVTTAIPPTSPAPTSALPTAPQELTRGNPDRPVVALTFDCGASSAPTPTILEILRASKIRATFFLTGKWVTQNPELAKEIATEHEIANHSYSHTDFAQLSDAQIIDEMERTEALITEVTGRGTRPFWRAPYGSRDQRIVKIVADAGWSVHVFWTTDALDWKDISPEQVRANINAKISNGAIVLQHCGSPQTAGVLTDVIRDISSRGLGFATISEMLGT